MFDGGGLGKRGEPVEGREPAAGLPPKGRRIIFGLEPPPAVGKNPPGNAPRESSWERSGDWEDSSFGATEAPMGFSLHAKENP
jgi:hypothetical protein